SFCLHLLLPPLLTLSPYTTLFRSLLPSRQILNLLRHVLQVQFVKTAGAQQLCGMDGPFGKVGIVQRLEGGGHKPILLETRSPLRSEEHTSELQSPDKLVCCLLLQN